MGPAPARPCESPGTAAPEVAGLSAPGRFGGSASGRVAGLGKEASRGNRPRRPPGLRSHRRCGPGGDLRCSAARDGAGRSALHRRLCHLRADRKDERIPHFVLVAGRRSKRTPRSHHINTVNALIPFRTFMQPFCGPASKNLTAYGRWHAAREQRGPLLPRCAQGAARFRPSRQHGLLTPPLGRITEAGFLRSPSSDVRPSQTALSSSNRSGSQRH